MAVASVYKRVLPCPPAIEFASQEGKVLFAEALSDGTMNGFFRLISTFQTQAEPAYCGLSTLTVVLNALSIDPGRKWKGPWRWFDESMLDCCEPLEKVKKNGITFTKVTCLAQCSGASVQAFRANQSSLDLFRSFVETCVSSDDHHLIVSYDRRPLKQTGTGHFSPLGGYHRQKDMALILDVARFKYPPHWVPLSLLWDAMNTIDEATGKSRGFMMIYKREIPACFLFTLSCKDERWRAMCKHILEEVPELLKTTNLTSTGQVIHTVFDSLPADIASFVKWIVEVKLAEDEVDRDETERLHYKSKVLQQLRQTTVFALITKWVEENCVKSSVNESLPNVIMQACCQGAAAFTGIKCSSNITCIKKEGEAEVRLNEDRGDTVVLSNKLLVDGCEQVIDALVPKISTLNTVGGPCQSSLEEDSFHPTTRDLLAILLLALPTSMWEDIPNREVHSEICRIVSREELPFELRLEVEHLWEQANLVSRSCSEET
uniref:glutathione gamma-glutamylcysteinyltransferase n=1 Tax=Athyrium yokoscense TaxID=65704 RepID=Q948S0_9MONI|nr:phytochelatin synthase [Athyrium yokoscense]